MVTLFCAIVGAGGSPFPVDIDEEKSVGHLKDAITAKSEDITVPAKDLKLFLAKTEGGAWLKGAGVEAVTIGKASGLFGGNFQAGEDEVHVLVVVSKQAISASIVSQDGVFDHCSDPFFAQFSTVEQVGDWLEFSSLLALTKRQNLSIRSSYKVIADRALMNPDRTMVKYAVVTGTPGIGKSVFVYYMMWRLIKEKKRVLFFSKKGPIYFDGSTMFQCVLLPNKFDQRFWSPDLWCLVDSVDPTAMTELPIEDCSVLLASTPR